MIVKTPPMGWNSWNTFGHDINENLIFETADAMVKEGLLDAGYEYLVRKDAGKKRQTCRRSRKISARHEVCCRLRSLKGT